MVVNRTTDQEGPAKLTLYFREPGATLKSDTPQPSSSAGGLAKAPKPAEGERIVTIEMKNRHSDAILKELMEKSGAVPVAPTAQDEADMLDAKDLEEKGVIDRERIKKLNDAARREKALIAQAHSEAAAIKAAA